MRSGYVVIYDDEDAFPSEEQYYGYFDSEEEAEAAFRDMIAGEEGSYCNAHVCRIIKEIKL